MTLPDLSDSAYPEGALDLAPLGVNPVCPNCGHQVPTDADSSWYAGYQYGRASWAPQIVVEYPSWWRRLLWRWLP